MASTLAHTIVAPEAPPDHWLYVLHGIFGSGRNWASLARRLVKARPEWGVVLVDLRLHGGSVGFEPPHTVEASSKDVARLAAELSRPATALFGHSFGGKVALLAGNEMPPGLRQIWVVDSPLGPRDPAGSAWEVLQFVKALPDRFDSRDALVAAMAANGYVQGLGQWMAMNLERSEDGFRWRIDWQGVEEMLRDYHVTDVWSLIETPTDDLDLHFIKAKQSNAISGEAVRRLGEIAAASGRVHLHEIDGSHWINVDNPDGVETLLESHLSR